MLSRRLGPLLKERRESKMTNKYFFGKALNHLIVKFEKSCCSYVFLSSVGSVSVCVCFCRLILSGEFSCGLLAPFLFSL